MTRAGQLLSAWQSVDGTSWNLVATADFSNAPLPSTLPVGVGAGSLTQLGTSSLGLGHLGFNPPPLPCPLITITSQRRSVTNGPCETNCVTFTVSATGLGTLTYQPYFNDMAIPGISVIVHCTARDGSSNTSVCSFTVTVTNGCRVLPPSFEILSGSTQPATSCCAAP